MKTLLAAITVSSAVVLVSGCETPVVEVHRHYYYQTTTSSSSPAYSLPSDPTPLKDEGAPDNYEAVPQAQ